MNAPTITMDPAEAAFKAREYSEYAATMIASRERDEFLELAKLHAVAAKGKKLLQLSAAFRTVPRDANGRPRLAIARRDRRRVEYTPYNLIDRFSTDYKSHRGRRSTTSFVEIPREFSPLRIEWTKGYALVPFVPPGLRMRRDLAKHFTLWEVEAWANSEMGVTPDVDPYLLRQITDDVYSVVGQWDLSPLEQAVLAARAQEL